jgi:hypothetical protein
MFMWILLKKPLGRKILDFWGIKSPCLYRKNPSTGILERLFFVIAIRFFTMLEKRVVFQQNLCVDATPYAPLGFKTPEHALPFVS